jgi:hypothetical protein
MAGIPYSNMKTALNLRPSSKSCPPSLRTFAEALGRVEKLVLADFDQEIAQKQLYYHTREHANAVRRRASQLFDALRPYLADSPTDILDRMKGLLELCAMAHDAIQIFQPQTLPHTPRYRQPGTSEVATIERLIDHFRSTNHAAEASSSPLFTEADVEMIRDAIEATICAYDPAEQAIYQPRLYQTDRPLSLVAHILALADIGGLGIDGVAFYNQEGSLIFLEDNPDIIPLIVNGEIPALQATCPDLYENLRQRLQRRTRFQVSFARSRLARYPREVARLPAAAVPAVTRQVFKYLTPETVHMVESTTPTHDHTPLEVLIQFFKLERHLKQLL